MIPDLLFTLYTFTPKSCVSLSYPPLCIGYMWAQAPEGGKRRLDFNRKDLMFILPGPVFCSLVATPF